MIYKTYKELIDKLQDNSDTKRLALVMSEDDHALEAVFEAYQNNIVTPILIGDTNKTKAMLDGHGYDYSNVEMIHVEGARECALKAISLVLEGKADMLMKGKLQTADLMREIVNKENGFRKDGMMSHLSCFEIPKYHKLLFLSDAGLCVYPDVDQKQQLIENMLDFTAKMGYKNPKVGIMCAVETFNPKMRECVDAKELKERWEKGIIKDCIVEGPISFDLATNQEKAVIKGYESPVAGDVDIMIVPDLTSGNLAAKAFIEFGDAIMTGIIWGAKCPIVVTSRGASFEEKYYSLVIAATVS